MANYKESEEILEKIKQANNIVINCHTSPDPDSIGSALAVAQIISDKFSKDVTFVCPSVLPPDMSFLPGVEQIVQTDFSTYDFSKHDLFLILDSSSFDMVTGNKSIQLPSTFKVVIDHHKSNTHFGDINLVDNTKTSTAEMLYNLFADWNIAIDENLANYLLTGILGDTGIFQFANVGSQTLRVGAELIDLGADKDKIVFNLIRRNPAPRIRIMGAIAQNLQIDEEFKMAWSVLPYEKFEELGADKVARELSASLLLRTVEDTNFCILLVETLPNSVSVNLRSRVSSFDVSQIAIELGGGGHKNAAGARILGPFQQAVDKALSVARSHAKQA